MEGMGNGQMEMMARRMMMNGGGGNGNGAGPQMRPGMPRMVSADGPNAESPMTMPGLLEKLLPYLMLMSGAMGGGDGMFNAADNGFDGNREREERMAPLMRIMRDNPSMNGPIRNGVR